MSENKSVKKVLLCRPSNFDVDYIINPYMRPHSVDKAKALRQWNKLVVALKNENIEVEVIEQAKGVPDMVFATDQGIIRKNEVLLANFRYPERQKERPYYREWFQEHGYTIQSLSNVFPFEGGDTLFFGDMLLVGTGFRASVSSCEELSHNLDIDVLPLRLTDAKYYHLDTALLIIDSKTAFYYPSAFSLNSKNLLKTVVRNLHELSQEQAEAFAANSFVSGDTVFIQSGISGFKRKLEVLDKKVIEIDVSEFKKAGGGIHCLINVLA
jgi:N-dimethylarginine dimethylaminohydrolase